jgi:solute carrier family 45 protein 1/2/4
MLVGAVIVSASLLVLGFTREIVAALGGGDGKDAATMRATVVLAVGAIYAVDFAINASMSCFSSA